MCDMYNEYHPVLREIDNTLFEGDVASRKISSDPAVNARNNEIALKALNETRRMLRESQSQWVDTDRPPLVSPIHCLGEALIYAAQGQWAKVVNEVSKYCQMMCRNVDTSVLDRSFMSTLCLFIENTVPEKATSYRQKQRLDANGRKPFDFTVSPCYASHAERELKLDVSGLQVRSLREQICSDMYWKKELLYSTSVQGWGDIFAFYIDSVSRELDAHAAYLVPPGPKEKRKKGKDGVGARLLRQMTKHKWESDAVSPYFALLCWLMQLRRQSRQYKAI